MENKLSSELIYKKLKEEYGNEKPTWLELFFNFVGACVETQKINFPYDGPTDVEEVLQLSLATSELGILLGLSFEYEDLIKDKEITELFKTGIGQYVLSLPITPDKEEHPSG
jgi:hypothetical protein